MKRLKLGKIEQQSNLLQRVIASDSVAIFDGHIDYFSIEDCHLAMLLAMTTLKFTNKKALSELTEQGLGL